MLAQVRETAQMLWSARGDDELVDTVGLVAQLSSALAAVEAGAVAEVEARDLATQGLRFGSTGDWLTHTGGLRRGEGKQRVVRAKALTGSLGRTFEALVAGTVSLGQVDTIITAVADLPPGELIRRRGEKLMVPRPPRLNGTELARSRAAPGPRRRPRRRRPKLQAALEREERAAHLDRYLAITEDRAGGVWIKGHGTAEDGALLTAALLPLTRPEPASHRRHRPGDRRGRATSGRGDRAECGRDLREYGARLWDALVLLARHGLDTDLVPDTHGTPPRLLITLDHHTLINDLKAAGTGRDRAGTGRSPATAPTCHPGSCAAWPVTPRSSPPSSAPDPRSSTSAAPAAWSPPPSGPPS